MQYIDAFSYNFRYLLCMQWNMIWLTYLLHSVIDKGLFGALGLLKNMVKWFFSDWHYEVGYFLVPVLSNEPEFKIDMKWIDIFKFEDFFRYKGTNTMITYLTENKGPLQSWFFLNFEKIKLCKCVRLIPSHPPRYSTFGASHFKVIQSSASKYLFHHIKNK